MGIQEKNNSIEVSNLAIRLGINLWRNNRGLFETVDGKRKYRAGLGIDGASDQIGIMPDGTFIAWEDKVGNKKPSKSQWAFINLVRTNGGIAGYGSKPEDFLNMLCEYYGKSLGEIEDFIKKM